MKDFSLELSAENIFNSKTNNYFQEVLSSYNAGNFRSAIVMLWSVVISDLVYKIQYIEAIFEDETTEVPGIINGSNSTVNLNGNIDYEKKLDYDLDLNKNLDISFAGIKLDIILQDYQQNPVDDGDYLVSVISNLDGNIIDKELSFSNGIATIDFNLLTKGEHLLTVIVDSMTITTDFSIDIQNSDLYLAGGNIDLNGYELNINSNLYHEKGNILINGGQLTVSNDYRLQRKTDTEDFENGSGILKMLNTDDLVLVNGDFIT